MRTIIQDNAWKYCIKCGPLMSGPGEDDKIRCMSCGFSATEKYLRQIWQERFTFLNSK